MKDIYIRAILFFLWPIVAIVVTFFTAVIAIIMIGCWPLILFGKVNEKIDKNTSF